MKPRVLFTTPVLQHPPIGGPALRVENSIEALSRVSELHLCSRVSLNSMGGPSALAFYRQRCETFQFSPSVTLPRDPVNFTKRAANFLARRTVKRNFFDFSPRPERDARMLLRLADKVKADVIWLGYGGISYTLLKYVKDNSAYKVVVDTDSVWSRFVLRGLSFARTPEERQRIERDGGAKEEEECWGTQLADVTTAVSEVDADYFRSLTKDPGSIRMFTNVIDPEVYRPIPPPAEGLRRPSIYLAGSFFKANCPMLDAARWVIREILPIVRGQIPGVHLYIVGSRSDQFLSDVRDPGITITGQAPSVLPYLCHVDVALVPLRWESGTRFKILEAGACGIPVVSTRLGAEGLPVVHEKDILIADTPESFAESVIRMLEDRTLAARLAANLRELVLRDFSVETLAAQGKDILDYLSGRGGPAQV